MVLTDEVAHCLYLRILKTPDRQVNVSNESNTIGIRGISMHCSHSHSLTECCINDQCNPALLDKTTEPLETGSGSARGQEMLTQKCKCSPKVFISRAHVVRFHQAA